jgi:hypothetical protein
MALLRKGIRDIRTLSGRVDRVSLPYRAYLKISCLEMEKARRTREKESAQEGIARIDARLAEIEAEKAALLQALKDMAQEGNQGATASGGQEPAGKAPGEPRGGGFKFRY